MTRPRVVQGDGLDLVAVAHGAHARRYSVKHSGGLEHRLLAFGDVLAAREGHGVTPDAAAGRDERDARRRVGVRLHGDARGRDGARAGVHARAVLGEVRELHERPNQGRHTHGVVAVAHEPLALRPDGCHDCVRDARRADRRPSVTRAPKASRRTEKGDARDARVRARKSRARPSGDGSRGRSRARLKVRRGEKARPPHATRPAEAFC
mmetsp:Transcript_15140/g.63896  ORF Transcript_15140/g.63896 Transcript_15140/m.63896 type:complete len:208 (+) Transcript_15140:2516-3139(+)